RRRHTRWPRDWSSDVCSSDLAGCRAFLFDDVKTTRWAAHASATILAVILILLPTHRPGALPSLLSIEGLPPAVPFEHRATVALRSEERRVGKECRSRRGGCRE